MKKQGTPNILAGAAVLLALTEPAQATLFSRLNGLAVYDSDQNITWIADANLGVTSAFGVTGIGGNGNSSTPGSMTQPMALDWIAGMNTAGYLGYNDWRLPKTPIQDPTCADQGQVDQGYHCTGSELGHLFYVDFGAVPGVTVQFDGDPDLNLFQNIQYNKIYWSGTLNPFDPNPSAFAIDASINSQFLQAVGNFDGYFAWAVRDGDVVPVPAAAWLFGGALAALGVRARRRQL